MSLLGEPLNPSRTQWSDDGTHWWDGGAWVPKDAAAARQEEVASAQALAAQQAEQRAQQEYAQQYAAWQQSHQDRADIFVPGAAPPPPPLPAMPPPPSAPRATGYALGLASFLCALPWIAGIVLRFWAPRLAFLIVIGVLPLIPAIVLGHVSRAQSRRAGLPPVIWSRWGLFFGYPGVVISALAIAGAVSLLSPSGRVGQSLRVAADYEDHYHQAFGSYAQGLDPKYYHPGDGVTVTILRADATSYCMRGTGYGTTLYLTRGGKVTKQSCA